MASLDGSKSVHESSDDGSRFECSPCDYEGTKKEAKYYCPQCQDYLCDSCNSTHKKLSVSRNHKIVSGNEMPKTPGSKANENIKRSVQCPCGGKDITQYCKDHNEIICVDCKTLKHRNCSNSTIEEACDDLDKEYTIATKERMAKLKAKLEQLQQNRNEDAENLTRKSTECRDTVEEIKRELMRKIEDLAATALEDIAKCDREQRLVIEQHINTCSTALNRMELDDKPFEEAVNAGINTLIFIHYLQLEKTLTQMDSILQDVEHEIIEPEISFDFDERLKITGVQSLGVVRSTTVKDTRPLIADMKIKSIDKVDVKFPNEQSVPLITGSLFMPNGELIFCDSTNNSVKALNADFTQKERLQISSRPWDLCLIGIDELVITQPDVTSLLFMKAVPRLQTGSSITLDQSCYGIAVKDGLIYVSFDSGEIRILDRTGQQQRNVYSGFSFQYPYYISVMSTGTVYVSECGGHNIRVQKDGKEIENYSKTGISSPMGMYIDGAENILLCERDRHNLRIIDTKTQTSKVLLSETDGLYQPHTVSVRPNDNTLIVGGLTETLVVCKMVAP